LRILVFSDLHYRQSRISDCEKVLGIIHSISKKENVDLIVNCGDTFHDKGLIRSSCIESYYRCRKMFDVGWVDIVGNHDQDDSEGLIHPLYPFGLFPYSHVVSSQLIWDHEKIAFFAYTKDMDRFEILRDKSMIGCVVFVHAGINGAFMNDSIEDKDGLPVEVFKKSKTVISGHYHKPHEFGNIIYVGSPMQHSFGEMDQQKSVLIYDTKDHTYSRRMIEGISKHYRVGVSWLDGEIQIESDERITPIDFVRVEMKGSVEQVRSMSRDKFDFIDCKSLKFETDVDDVFVSRLNISNDDLEHQSSLVQKYVEYLSPDLDLGRLMEVYNGLS